MVTMDSMKKMIITILLSMIVFIGISILAPVKAHASTTGQIGDVNVSVDNNGKLTINGGGIDNNGSSASAWNNFIKKYKNFIVGISGVGAVSMILFFVMNFMKLGATAGNPNERQKVIMGLIWSGVAAAGLGAVTTFVGIFYNMLK